MTQRIWFLTWPNPDMGFPHGSDGKHFPAMQETTVQSLRWKDALKKAMATHSSILA